MAKTKHLRKADRAKWFKAMVNDILARGGVVQEYPGNDLTAEFIVPTPVGPLQVSLYADSESCWMPCCFREDHSLKLLGITGCGKDNCHLFGVTDLDEAILGAKLHLNRLCRVPITEAFLADARARFAQAQAELAVIEAESPSLFNRVPG